MNGANKVDVNNEKANLLAKITEAANKLYNLNDKKNVELFWYGYQVLVVKDGSLTLLNKAQQPAVEIPFDRNFGDNEEIHYKIALKIALARIDNELETLQQQRLQQNALNALHTDHNNQYKPKQDISDRRLSEFSLYDIQQGDGKSAIRIQNNDELSSNQWQHKQIVNKMSGILADAIKNTQQATANSPSLEDAEFIKFVIKFAQENRGVGNAGVDEWLKYSRTTLKNYNAEKLTKDFEVAKELSYQYQKAAERSGFFTGRTQGLKTVVGQRLCRIPIGETNTIVDGALALSQSQAQ